MAESRASPVDRDDLALRPITPQDRDALEAGFERLSEESRYRRFFTPMPRLSARDLDYLTHVDHHDHEALVAVEEPTGDIVAVARYVRTGPGEAEPAIAVADDWQGQGLGGELLDALAKRAREEDIVRFRAPVLATNTAALGLLRQLGDTVQRQVGNEVECDISLAPEPTARGRLLMLLRGVANGTLTPAGSLLQQFASRGPAVPPEEARNTLVVGTDGSDDAAGIVAFAGDLALALGASVQLVTASWPLIERREASDAALEALARELRARTLDVEVHVRRATPAASLIDVAAEQGARMVIVGDHRREGNARLLPGSVADTVARQAPCAVLIFRRAAS